MTYSLFKTLHIAGAILLLGNVTVTGFWAIFLYRQRERLDFRPVARAIMWADYLFTVLGGALLTWSGIMLAVQGGYRIGETPWIMRGVVALALSTAIWGLVLLPCQWRMERLEPGDTAELRRVFVRWNTFGWMSTALLFYGLWAMVGKR